MDDQSTDPATQRARDMLDHWEHTYQVDRGILHQEEVDTVRDLLAEVDRLTRAVTTLDRTTDELFAGTIQVIAERDQALVKAGVERARADKANRRLANITTRINDELAAEVQRQKANTLRETADSLTPDVLRGAPIHPNIIVTALRSRADKLDPQGADR